MHGCLKLIRIFLSQFVALTGINVKSRPRTVAHIAESSSVASRYLPVTDKDQCTTFFNCLSCIAGLTTEQAEESFLLEVSQGDSISGKITREEAASVVAAALNTPASRGEKECHLLLYSDTLQETEVHDNFPFISSFIQENPLMLENSLAQAARIADCCSNTNHPRM